VFSKSIGIVGSGAVARSLGRALRERGALVAAIASRTHTRAADAAAVIGPEVRVVPVSALPALTSHIIVAVNDEAIGVAARALAGAGMRGGVVLHTCGSRGPEALAPLPEEHVACGVLHPLQTIVHTASHSQTFDGVSFGVAGDPPAVAWAVDIAALLGSRVLHVNADGMGAYHAAAVLSSNAIAALLDAALALMAQAGIDRDAALSALAPLTTSAVNNAFRLGPLAAATGPLVRGDAETIGRHLDALASARADVEPLYRAASRTLLDMARRRGLDPDALARLDAALAPRHHGDLS
jgi:predicted short-subunit dehydrogenase-like oxidoreductase (DUF2520 family)